MPIRIKHSWRETSTQDYLIIEHRPLVLFVVDKYFSVYQYLGREDMVQAGHVGLIKAARKIDLCKPYEFSSFAVPIIKAEIINFIRTRWNTPLITASDEDVIPLEDTRIDGDNFYDTYLPLYTAINRLITRHREFIMLYYFENKDTREIGKLHNINTHAVDSVLYRARNNLRTLLGGSYFVE